MATDKKSDHYTPPSEYRDIDGLHRTFTYVDHDPKTSISKTQIDGQRVKQELVQYRSRLQEQILGLPASAAPHIFDDFRVREGNEIVWNQNMIMDEGTPLQRLIDIHTLTTKRIEMYS